MIVGGKTTPPWYLNRDFILPFHGTPTLGQREMKAAARPPINLRIFLRFGVRKWITKLKASPHAKASPLNVYTNHNYSEDRFTTGRIHGLLVDRGTQELCLPVGAAAKTCRNTTTELRNKCRRNGRINTWSVEDLAEPSRWCRCGTGNCSRTSSAGLMCHFQERLGPRIITPEGTVSRGWV